MDEAKSLVKKANKLLSPSLMAMRMKPDWDQATPMLEQAARLYARLGAHRDAQHAFEKAGEGQRKLGSELHAVKHLESAAECASKDKRFEDAFNLYQQCYEMFAGIGKIALGAASLSRGARLFEEKDQLKLAQDLYNVGIEAIEDESETDMTSSGTLLITAQEMFRNLTKILVQNKKFEEAARNELRYAAFMSELSSFEGTTAISRAYLQAIVLNLIAGSAKEALATKRDCETDPAFSGSKNYSTSQDLMDTCGRDDYDGFMNIVKNSGILYELDNTVARHLKKMSQATFSNLAKEIGPMDDVFKPETLQAEGLENEDDLT